MKKLPKAWFEVCTNCGGQGFVEAWDHELEEVYIEGCVYCYGLRGWWREPEFTVEVMAKTHLALMRPYRRMDNE